MGECSGVTTQHSAVTDIYLPPHRHPLAWTAKDAWPLPPVLAVGPPREAGRKISPSVCNLSGKVARHSRLLKLWTRRRASPTLCLSRRSLRQIADSRFESEGEVSQGAFRSADSSCFAPFYFGSRELHRRDAFHPGSLRSARRRFSGGRKGEKRRSVSTRERFV